MKFSTFGSLCRAETKSRFSGNLFFRPCLEHLEDRRLLSVSPSFSASGDTIHVSVATIPDLTITKVDNAGGSSITPSTGNVTPNQTLIYTIVASNTGTGGESVTVTDPIGPPGTFDTVNWTAASTGSVTTTGFTTSGSGSISQGAFILPAGGAITYSVTVVVDALDTGELTNTATITPSGGTGIPATATDTDNLVNLFLTKSDDHSGTSNSQSLSYGFEQPGVTGSTEQGDILEYKVLVSNEGPGNATGVTIKDTFPAGFEETSWTATQSGGASGATLSNPTAGSNIDDTNVSLPSGSSITYTVSGSVVASGGTLSNTATVTPPVGGKVTATDTDNLADLTITKIDNAGGSSITPSTGNVTPGQSLIYTVVVSNTGPGEAAGVTIADPVPSNFTGSTWTATSTGSATGFSTSGSGNINQTGVTLPAGSSITYVITGTVSSAATGALTNTATITPPTGTAKSATDTDNLADLSITKIDNAGGSSITPSTGNVTPGQSLTYSVVVSNTGTGGVTGATITDPIPSDLTGDTWTAASTGSIAATGFATSGTGNIDQTGVNLPAGSAITYTITGTVSSTATGSLSNTATVTPPTGTAKTATDTDNLADLSITKVDNAGGSSITPSTGNVTSGQSLTYTVVVSNTGPGNATGAAIIDPIPSELADDTWTAASTGSATATGFATSGTGSINQTGVNLPANSAITYTITGTVSSTATGTLSNTAIVAPPGGTAQTATDTDNLADLSITKIDNAGGSSITPSTGHVTAGQSLTYTVVVSNTGPGNVTGATIVDPVPSNFTSDAWTAASTGSASGFATSGTGNINQTGVNLPAGSAITYTITGTVSSTATGTLTNAATVTPPSGTAKTATDTDNVAAPAVSSLSGYVYVDANQNHAKDPGEPGIPNVVVVLTGTTNASTPVNLSTTTDSTGLYSFANLAAGNYTITETQPTNFIEGTNDNQVGSQNSGTVAQTATTNAIQKITLAAGVNGANNNFGNVGETMGSVSKRSFLDPSPILTITKVDNAGGSSITNTTGNVTQGQSLTYTIVVSNVGPSPATGATIADSTLSTDLSSDTWTATSTSSPAATGFSASGSGNIDDTDVTLPAGSSITYVITGTVSSTVTGILSNTASVTPFGSSSETATDTDNLPNLSITKVDNAGGSSVTATTGNVTPGQSLTYTVVVSNTGPGNVTGATITDPIPSDLTGDTWTAASTGSATATGFATSGSGNINQAGVNLPANSAITYTVTGTVISTATGTFSNTATVAPPVGPSKSATDTDNLADLSITKVDNAGGSSITPSTGNVTPGQSLIYTVVVSNTGPGNVTGATITDPIPSDITGDTWTATSTGSASASGFATSGSGNINQTGVNLPANSAITYTITGTVITTATGTLSNTATVTPPSGTAKTATDNDNLIDLSITKVDNAGGSSITPSTGNVTPGQSLTYTVVVGNTGPGNATNVTITDPIPPDFTGDTWTAASTGSASASGFATSGSGNVDQTGVNLPADSAITYTITGTVSSTATGTLSNSATVAPPTGTTKTATDTDNLADLSITKVDDAGGSSITPSTGNVTPGQSLTYTVVVSNTGPGNVTGATISDPIPADITGDTWTAASTGSVAATGFATSGTGNINQTGVNLPANSAITYTITGTVLSTATGTLSNSATVTPPSGTAKTATDTDNLADLSITKVDNAGGSSITPSTGNVTPGQSLTYTVVVSNTGPGNVTGATITDPIPADLTGDTWTAASTGSVAATGFATSGTGNISQTGVNLPANSAITYTITGTVLSTATGTFLNTATVTPPTGTPKTATDNDNLADLSITKVDNAGGSSITPSTGNVTPGQSLTYTVVVSNTGPGNVTGATITDPIPADITGDTWTAASTGSATATGFATSGTGNINQSGVNLPANSAITYTITGTVLSTATGTFSNTATVTPPTGTAKTATDGDNLADLSITKVDNVGGSSITPSTGNVLQGQSMTYTVVVSNTGPGNVTGATITDPIPADLTGDTWTAASTGSVAATGFATSGTGNINQSGVNLPANSAITYTITGTVLSTATGTFSNTATVAPPVGPSKSATDTDNVANLSITKVDNAGGSSITPSTGNVTPGQSLTYTVVVGNTGPGNATNVTITDPIPPDFTGDTWTAASTGSASGFATSGSGNVDQTGVNLPANSAITYTITGTVLSTATGTFSNTATVTPPTGTAKTATDSDNLPNLSITKVDNAGGSSITPSTGSVTDGFPLQYTIVVHNAGPGSAVGATIIDTFPSGYTVTSWVATQTGGATGFSSSGSGNISDTATLPSGSSITYVISGSPNTTGPLSNTAGVSIGTFSTTAVDQDNVTEGIQVVHFTNNAIAIPAAASTASTVPTAANAASLDAAAVDFALANEGRHSWQSSGQNAKTETFSTSLGAAPAGGSGSGGSLNTPSTSSFAAQVDLALLNLHESLLHRFA